MLKATEINDNSRVILSGVVGSVAYGLATPTSDVDMKGVYVAPFLDVIGLNAAEVISNSQTQHNPDSEFHEVAKYIKLALKCNPTILEMLYLNQYEILTEEGKLLVSNRSSFLSEPSIRGSYGAYAKAQADRLIRRNEEGKEGFSSDTKARTAKHGRHCMRLLIQGGQLLREGVMDVDVSEHREWLFKMGMLAANDPLNFYGEYLELANEFDDIVTTLPRFPDREVANEILQKIRLASILDEL